MKYIMRRIIGFALVLSILLTSMPISVSAAENDYAKGVSERFEKSFDNDTYFVSLLDKEKNNYKLWADEIEKMGLDYKLYMWASDKAIDKELDAKAYVVYLSTILSLIEKSTPESMATQAQYFSRVKTEEFVAGAANAVSGIVGAFDGPKLLEYTSLLTDTIDIKKLTERMATDSTQIGILAVTNVAYENKLAFLEAVRDNTDDKELKEAANDMIKMCDLQYIYVLENYIGDAAKLSLSTAGDIFDIDLYDDVIPHLLSDIEKSFVPFLKEVIDPKAGTWAENILAGASQFASILGLLSTGFTIGATIMKLVMGNQAELFREMKAMDAISDALADAFLKTSRNCYDGDYETRLANIKKYVAIGQALIHVHVRGDFCSMECRGEQTYEEYEREQRYWYYLEKNMNEYSDVLEWILIGDIEVPIEKKLTQINKYTNGVLECQYHMAYDTDGRISNVVFTYGENEPTQYTYVYDNESRLIRSETSLWSIPNATFTYSSDGKLLSWTEAEGNEIVYSNEYDSDGRVYKTTGDNGMALYIREYEYNDANVLTSMKESVHSAGLNESWFYAYEYDSEEKLFSVTLNNNGDQTKTVFSYDSKPFVIKEDVTHGIKNLSIVDKMNHDIFSLGVGDASIVTDSDGYLISAVNDYSKYEFIYDGVTKDSEETTIAQWPEGVNVSTEYKKNKIDRSYYDDAGNLKVQIYYDQVIIQDHGTQFDRINDYILQDAQKFLSGYENQDYESFAMYQFLEDGAHFISTADAEVTHNDNSIFSICITTNLFMGGPVTTDKYSMTYDLDIGEPIDLATLFGKEENEMLVQLKDISWNYVQSHYANELFDGAREIIYGYELEEFKYYFENNELIITFPTYELSSGAAGSLRVPTGLKIG